MVEVATNRTDLVVYDREYKMVTSQINPVTKYEETAGFNDYNLFFMGTLEPLSFTTFYVKIATSDIEKQNVNLAVPEFTTDAFKVGNGPYSLSFDEDGLLSDITNNYMEKTAEVHNNWAQYVPTGVNINIHYFSFLLCVFFFVCLFWYLFGYNLSKLNKKKAVFYE